ncbi:hypothetical protein VM1G_06441 [Cytospora mali]|uniref:Rhodopsin domain-containing protein n=1 Tax=Cytospora mali TaxID=578113 RepID=A0A194W1G2_CYTMA|nr:hypothetical protein VM1G_06441 [Valsa mali]
MLGVMWMFQAIAFILVGLRLYTRLVVMSNYGWDDHFFNAAVGRLFAATTFLAKTKDNRGIRLGTPTAYFLLLVYTVLMTVAACFGLGQTMTDPSSAATSHALLLVNIGQTVTSITIIFVKISIAMFLLRIVNTNRGQMIAVIIPVTVMSIIVFVAAWVLWFACTPVSYSWDITVPDGHCNPATEFWAALVSGVSIVIVEVFYASFPWYLIRGLQMPKREKILIGTSMSFGYIIYRLLTLLKLAYASDEDFLLTIVDLLIWHAADITTQLVCIGVTVCRPLYKDWLYRIAEHIESISSSLSSTKEDTTYRARNAPALIALQTIGGSAMPQSGSDAMYRKASDVSHHTRKLGSKPRNRNMEIDAISEEYMLDRELTVDSDRSSAGGRHQQGV